MNVLAGDIGGTKTILALARVEGASVTVLREERFRSADYRDFTSMAREFLSREDADVGRAGCGVAGPVVDGRARVTNLPWVVDADRLARDLGLERVRLINDFVAVAHGIDALDPSDLALVNAGEPDPEGPFGILGAGTGLGEAVGIKVHGRRLVLSSEGGHADLAVRSELEIDFLRWMRRRHARVSYERVLSGPGLGNLYRFLRDTGKVAESEIVRRAIAAEGEEAPVVTRLAEDDPLCAAALDCFVSVFGAEAGNMALRAVATGGVYIAGGIAPRIVDRLRGDLFRRAYLDKGRLSSMVAAIPVYVVMNPTVGLLGAAVHGASS